MSVSFICSTCRRNLFKKAVGFSRQSKAGFISLARPLQDPDVETRKKFLELADDGNLSSTTSSFRARPRSRKSDKDVANAGDLLESFFEAGLDKGSVIDESSAQAASLKVYEHLETLKRLASARTELHLAWRYYHTYLSPKAIAAYGIRTTNYPQYKPIITSFLGTMIGNRSIMEHPPSLTDVVESLIMVGGLKARYWTRMMRGVLEGLAQLQQREVKDKIQELSMIDDLMSTWRLVLIEGNQLPPRLVFEQGRDDWSFWPSITPTIKYTTSLPNTFAFTLFRASDHRHYAKDYVLCAAMTLQCIAAHAKMYAEEASSEQLLSHPFVAIVAHILATSSSPVAQLNDILVSRGESDVESTPIMKTAVLVNTKYFGPALKRANGDYAGSTSRTPVSRSPSLLFKSSNADHELDTSVPTFQPLKSAPHSAAIAHSHIDKRHPNTSVSDASKNTSSTEPDASHLELPTRPPAYVRKIQYGGTSIHASLNVSVAAGDIRQVEKLWDEARNYDVVHSSPDEVEAGNRPQTLGRTLCHHFIKAFMSLQKPEKAIEVWSHMISVSLRPNQASWNALLEGCRSAKNISGLEALWVKMIASGTKPDVLSWTTRISGLFRGGNHQKALQALSEMGHNWAIAIKKLRPNADLTREGDAGDVVKPTVENINAALVGSLRIGRQADAQRVLAWGATLGIVPNVITYNTLLNPLIKSGDMDAASALLKQMEQQGVVADTATFTTILYDTMRLTSMSSPEEQRAAVDEVFSGMEATGIKPNLYTYSKMIDSLLGSTTNDIKAVQAVLTRMAENGLKPNSHIYTSLLTFYFARTPPDLEAAGSVIDRVRHSSYIPDSIFWDRAIEGYANAGDTGRALTLLGKEDKPGRRTGWWAMTTVLEALCRNGEFELATQVVNNVKQDRGGPISANIKGVQGQHSFWDLAKHQGLI